MSFKQVVRGMAAVAICMWLAPALAVSQFGEDEGAPAAAARAPAPAAPAASPVRPAPAAAAPRAAPSTGPARPGPAAPSASAASTPSPGSSSSSGRGTTVLDRVIAVVNDEALTQWDLNEQRRMVLQQMKSSGVTPPSRDVLDKQVLERLVSERALLQFAKENGIRIDDTTVERTVLRIAEENKMQPDEFRKVLEKEGIQYANYREDLRRELTVQRIREREVDNKLQVSDAEVANYLATVAAQGGGENEYLLSHVYVGVQDQASPEQIEARRRRAEEALAKIKAGDEFGQVAAGYSDAPDALQGGSLGWRTPARLPSVFADVVAKLKPGEVSDVMRSAAGFHVVKLVELRNRNSPTVVDQSHVRHILIKVNETTSEIEAKARIDRVRDRITQGSSFEDMAKLNSDDISRVRGGDLGWVSPSDTVPDFEKAMDKLALNELSQPVRTPFGWHLIQVTERRRQDITEDKKKDQARTALRQRKSDEGFQDFIRQLRDRTYVEMKADDR